MADQTYEEILDNSSSSQNGSVEEGFQKIWLKNISISEYDSDYHDVGLDIIVAPEEYPDWDIYKTIWGDWNLNVDRKASIWKVTGFLDSILKQLEKSDIESKVFFDTAVEPPELMEDHIKAINDELDKLPMYGYLFEGRRKKSDANILFWQVHYHITHSPGVKRSVNKSFNNWKNNEMVQKHWIFEEDDEPSFEFGSNTDSEEEEPVEEEENSFLGI